MPFPTPGDLPNLGIEPASPASSDGFFTTEPRRKPFTHVYISVCVCVCVCVCILVYPGHIKKLEILNRKALIQIGLMLQYMKLFSRSKEQRAQYVNSYSPFHFLPCLLFILLCLLSGGVTGEARTRILFVNNWCFSVLKETVQKQLHAFPSGHTATPGPLLGRNSGASTAYL